VISSRALARPTVAAATLACLGTFALAGCSQPTTDVGRRPASSTTTSAEPTPTATKKATPAQPAETTTSVAPEPSDDPSADGGDTGTRLLGAADVPGFNDQFRWQDGRTSSTEPRALFGTCQRFALTSIGATAVTHRTYLPATPGAGTDQAAELVAEFPDSTTARRAFAVLKSWRASCADRLTGREHVRVGALQDVAADGGTAGWYLVNYGPVPDDHDALYFDAQGMAVVGSRIAMVKMILAGQDYEYEAGHEPMVTALQHAAARLT
jgi:hypothetical protein